MTSSQVDYKNSERYINSNKLGKELDMIIKQFGGYEFAFNKEDKTRHLV
jgi:hypothetical protein